MRTLGIGLLGLALAGFSTGCSTNALPAGSEPQQQALVGCSDRTIYTSEGPRILEHDAQGGSRERFVFGTEGAAPDTQLGMSHWQAKGAFLVAGMYLPPSGHTIVLLDHDRVQFQRSFSGSQPIVHLAADGSLAIGGDKNIIRRADGAVVELGEFEPIGPLLSDGTLPVSRGPSFVASSPHGLLRPDGPAAAWRFDTFVDPPLSYRQAHATSERIVYLSGPENETLTNVRLVATNGKGTTRIDLPGSLDIAHVAGDRWVLLTDWETTRMTLVDLATSNVTRIEREGAVSHFDLKSATVDEAGRVFTSVARDAELQLVRTDDGGKTFVDVGAPMPRGEDLGFPPWLAPIAHHGSALTLNLSTGYGSMLNSVQFTADRTRTIMPGGGFYLSYNPGTAEAALSADGQCAASWVLSDGDPFGTTAKYSLVVFDQDGPRVIATARTAYPTVSFSD